MPLGRRRSWFAAAALGVAAVAGGVTWGVMTGSASDKSDALPRALEAATAAGDTVAARVNGVDVPLAIVDALVVQAQAFPFPDLDLSDRERALDFAIRSELLRQEREKRGLEPSSQEVLALVIDQQRSTMAIIKDGSADPAFAALVEGYAKIGHPIEGWQEDEFILGMFAATMGETMLQKDESKDIPHDAPNRMDLVLERMDQLVERLRREATIEILID